MSGTVQFISDNFLDFKYSFVFEKCLQPKNAPPARGDGCGAVNTKCLSKSIKLVFDFAKFPHNKKTQCSFSSDIFL